MEPPLVGVGNGDPAGGKGKMRGWRPQTSSEVERWQNGALQGCNHIQILVLLLINGMP